MYWVWKLNLEKTPSCWDWCRKIPLKISLRLVNSLWGLVSINMIHIAQLFCSVDLFRVRKITQWGKIFDSVLSFKSCYEHKSERDYFSKIRLKCKIFFRVLKILRKFVMRVRKMVFIKKILLGCLRIIFKNLTKVFW